MCDQFRDHGCYLVSRLPSVYINRQSWGVMTSPIHCSQHHPVAIISLSKMPPVEAPSGIERRWICNLREGCFLWWGTSHPRGEPQWSSTHEGWYSGSIPWIGTQFLHMVRSEQGLKQGHDHTPIHQLPQTLYWWSTPSHLVVTTIVISVRVAPSNEDLPILEENRCEVVSWGMVLRFKTLNRHTISPFGLYWTSLRTGSLPYFHPSFPINAPLMINTWSFGSNNTSPMTPSKGIISIAHSRETSKILMWS